MITKNDARDALSTSPSGGGQHLSSPHFAWAQRTGVSALGGKVTFWVKPKKQQTCPSLTHFGKGGTLWCHCRVTYFGCDCTMWQIEYISTAVKPPTGSKGCTGTSHCQGFESCLWLAIWPVHLSVLPQSIGGLVSLSCGCKCKALLIWSCWIRIRFSLGEYKELLTFKLKMDLHPCTYLIILFTRYYISGQ